MSGNVVVRLLSAMVIHSWQFEAPLSLVNAPSEALIITKLTILNLSDCTLSLLEVRI